MKSSSDISTQFDKHRKESVSGLSKQFQNTEECEEFYAGDFMSYRDRQFEEKFRDKQIIVQFNKVKPYVNAVKGFMAQNRRRAKFEAKLRDRDERTLYSDHTNAFHDYIRENANADQVETQADGDMLTVGYGAIETAISYSEGYASTDPNGEVVMGRLDPKCVGWDPYARAANLLDARYVWYKQQYDLDEAISLFDSQEEDFETGTAQQGEAQYNPGGGAYTSVIHDVDWAVREKNTANVYFYQWFEYEDFYRADNPLFQTTNPLDFEFQFQKLQEIAALNEEDSLFTLDPKAKILDCNAEQKKALEEFYGEIEFVTFKRKVFYGSVLSGKKVFSKFKLLSQQGFTIKFKTGDFDSKNKIWTGMVNSMRDPVLYYNKALTELLFTIAAGAKGGVMYEKTAVKNIRKFEANYNKTTAAVEVEDGALTNGRIQPKRQVYQPTGLEAILQIADASIPDVNGVDKTFLGSSENRLETAQLQRQRIKQVTSVLACYFDSITLYQKLHARMMLDFMRVMAKANPDLMFRIVGNDGETDLDIVNQDKLAAEYDVVTQEAPDSATEKAENTKIMTDMATVLMTAGDLQSGKAVLAVALKDMNINTADRQRLLQILIPEDGRVDPAYVKQLEEALKQAQNEQSQALLKEIVSKAMLNMAKTEETQAKTEKTAADTAVSLEEAQQKSVETVLMQNPDKVSVSV